MEEQNQSALSNAILLFPCSILLVPQCEQSVSVSCSVESSRDWARSYSPMQRTGVPAHCSPVNPTLPCAARSVILPVAPSTQDQMSAASTACSGSTAPPSAPQHCCLRAARNVMHLGSMKYCTLTFFGYKLFG